MNTDPHVLALGSRRIVQAVERQTDATLAPAGLTTAQGLVLLHILAQGEAGTSLTAMHRAFGTSMPTLSGILKCLRRQGYVQAVPCPGDERRKLLFATEQARQLQSFLSCTLQEGSNRLYRGFFPGRTADLCPPAAENVVQPERSPTKGVKKVKIALGCVCNFAYSSKYPLM